jgi:uncharacterized phage infection (PIP) family protein YhgE
MLLPPDPPPPQNPTVPVSRDEVQLGLLNKLVSSVADLKDGMANLSASMGNLERDLSTVANDVGIVKNRVALVEQRTNELEKRADSNSLRAKGQSQTDLEQQAQLAQEIDARKALAVKVDTLTDKTDAQTVVLHRIDSVASVALKNPVVKVVATALLFALVQWLANHGIHVALPQAGP